MGLVECVAEHHNSCDLVSTGGKAGALSQSVIQSGAQHIGSEGSPWSLKTNSIIRTTDWDFIVREVASVKRIVYPVLISWLTRERKGKRRSAWHLR
jgi:hypothetical protein